MKRRAKYVSKYDTINISLIIRQFRWQNSSISALPPAFRGAERYGQNCPDIWVRAVFVDWADFEGTYGFEQVNY